MKRELVYEKELINEVCEWNERRKHVAVPAGERLMTVWSRPGVSSRCAPGPDPQGIASCWAPHEAQSFLITPVLLSYLFLKHFSGW